MIRRAYCQTCGHCHRRDPETWTDRSCCRCGGEVLFSGGRVRRVVLRVVIDGDDLSSIAGSYDEACSVVRELVAAHIAASRVADD